MNRQKLGSAGIPDRSSDAPGSRRWLIGSVATALVGAGGAFTQAGPPSGDYRLVFADEFNGTSLDLMKWNYHYPWGRQHNHAAYWDESRVLISDGKLNLQAIAQRHPNAQDYWNDTFKQWVNVNYTSGAINTSGKFNATYGYFEASMKMDDVRGTWPAFWMLQNGWPPEIDIMEYPYSGAVNNNEYWVNYHYTNDSNNHASFGSKLALPVNLANAYHTYGVEWTASTMRFYFDGALKFTVNNPNAIADAANMYMLLNHGVGGWGGTPAANSEFPIDFMVDWVRVWQKPPSSNTVSSWKNTVGSSSWDTGGNWNVMVPKFENQIARFGDNNNASANVTWDYSRTVGGLQFDTGTAFTIGDGNAGLQLINSSGTATISVSANTTAAQNIVARLELYSNVAINNASSKPLTLSGQLIGTGDLTLNGPGTVIASANNTYTGSTFIQNGVFVLGGTTSTSKFVLGTNDSRFDYGIIGLTNSDFARGLGTTNGGLSWASATASGGFAAMNPGTRIVNIGGNRGLLTLNANGFYAGSDGTSGVNDPRIAFGDVWGTALGTIDFRNSLGLNGRLFKTVVNGAAQVPAILSGNIVGNGLANGTGQAFVKFGNGNIQLSGNNTYAGSTTAGGRGAIILGSEGAFSPNTWFVLAGDAASTDGGVLGLGAGDLRAKLAASAGGVSFGAGPGGFAAYGGDRTFTFVNTADQPVTATWGSGAFVQDGRSLVLNLPNADGTITFNNAIDLNGAARTVIVNKTNGSRVDAVLSQALSGNAQSGLTKTGAGTLALNAASTYGGATTVTEGKLLVNGSIAGRADVANGATLGGNGRIGGALAVHGTLSPGNSPDNLEIGGTLTLHSDATTVIELAGIASYDRLTLSGAGLAHTLDGLLNVALIDGFTLADKQAFGIVQVDGTSTLTGRFIGLPNNGDRVGTFGGQDLFITYNGNFSGSGLVATSGGNDVVLYTAVPEPTALALAGAALAAGLRRRRKAS